MLGLFKTVLFLVLLPFRAIYNWLFRRRIQKLYSEPPSPEKNQSKSSSHVVDFDQSWSNDWNNSDKDTNVSKIDQYRQQLIRQRSESKSDQTTGDGAVVANVDFFSDMEPQNVRQAKVFIGSNAHDQQNLHVNRLSVSTDEAYQPVQDAVSYFFFLSFLKVCYSSFVFKTYFLFFVPGFKRLGR